LINKYVFLKQDKKPKVLVVTPLSIGHKISRETKITLRRNKTPLVWLTSEGKFNIPQNVQFAINFYKAKFKKLPEYFLMIDRDITLGRGMVDKLVHKLSKQPESIAYAYASFSFQGHINQDFPARPFDIKLLIQHNYISSNSLFRTDIMQQVGLVTEDQYKRLLDWAFLLKLFLQGYFGIACPEANFIAASTKDDISAQSDEDYQLKWGRVAQTFIRPIQEQYKTLEQPEPEILNTKITELNIMEPLRY
jgi:hypothetical protein